MNRDFLDMLGAFERHGVNYLVVGAHALAFHGHPRYTGDLDLWVEATPANAELTWAALLDFWGGASIGGLGRDDFIKPDAVVQFGFPPGRIDLCTGLSGVAFADCWPKRQRFSLADGQQVNVLSIEDLKRNKLACGRRKDLLDAEIIDDILKRRSLQP